MITHWVDSSPVRDRLVLWKTEADGLQGLSLGGFETRHSAIVSLLEQADREYSIDPFGPIVIHTLDKPVSTVEEGYPSYAFCTAPGYVDVPVPDFVFGAWPEVGIDDFDETCWSIEAEGDRPAQLPVVGWIGSLRTHPIRTVLHRLGEERPDLLDIRSVTWVPTPAQKRLGTSGGNALSLAEQVAKWGALVDVEGKGYSGRVKLLLHSGRPLLIQDRPWQEWFWDSLVPMEHYIPVKRDLSDLVERARWVQENPEEAAKIGQAGQKLAQSLLTRASAVEQWTKVLSAASQPCGAVAPHPLRETINPLLSPFGVQL